MVTPHFHEDMGIATGLIENRPSTRRWNDEGSMSEPTGYRILTPQDLLNLEIPEPEWLVEDILPKGSIAVLSGPPKSGKGLLTMDLVASVAEGSDFLGKKVVQGPAIYVSAEESIGEVKVRLFNRIGENVGLPVRILQVDGVFDLTLKFENGADVAKFKAVVEEVEPVLIVLDVLRMMNDLEENDSNDMSRVMNEIRTLARSSGAAIVVNHHMNKNGVQRGSNAISGGADITIDLFPDASSNSFLSGSLSAKGRSVPPISLSIQFDGDARWIVTNSFSPSTPTNEEKILEHLRSTSEEQSVRDIAKSTGIPEPTARTVVSAIKRKNPTLLVETLGDGSGSPRLYRIEERPEKEESAA